MPSWLSSADETLAELDRLFARETERKGSDLAQLAAVVRGIGVGTESEPPPPSAPRRTPSVSGDDPRSAPPGASYPLLPRRTTPGGPYGASIIDAVAASVRRGNEW
jgi:hypothetical protein